MIKKIKPINYSDKDKLEIKTNNDINIVFNSNKIIILKGNNIIATLKFITSNTDIVKDKINYIINIICNYIKIDTETFLNDNKNIAYKSLLVYILKNDFDYNYSKIQKEVFINKCISSISYYYNRFKKYKNNKNIILLNNLINDKLNNYEKHKFRMEE